MEILARYIHGSEDSVDTDVYYVVDELPSFQECKEWCDSKKDENANLITIIDGIEIRLNRHSIQQIGMKD